jgi:hypothetical protein
MYRVLYLTGCKQNLWWRLDFKTRYIASLQDPEIVNVVVASTVKTYATFLIWISISLASPSFTLSGLR